jgi:hypothetical protein
MSGHMGSEIGIFGFFLIPPSCFALAFCAGVRSHNMKGSITKSRTYEVIEKRSLEVMIAASCGLLASTILWRGYAASYFCATPDITLLHPSVLERAQSYSWNDVKTVHAVCWASSRSPWQGGFALSFGDGAEILLRSGTNDAARERYYGEIKASLAGKIYHYDASGIGQCPGDVYRLFASWPN